MHHHMKLSAESFARIAAGTKVIESRLYDEKRQQLALGDEIVFCVADNPTKKIRAQVKGLLRYATFTELFADHDPALFGGESRASLLSQIRQFYSEEDEAKYDVVGIRVAVIDPVA